MTSKPSYMQWLIYAITLCAGLGGVLYGYDIGVISGALPLMQKSIALTLVQQEIIVGAVLAGSLVGTLLAGSAADRFGRRTMILIACIVFTLGVCTIFFTHQFQTLLFSRLLLGVGVGIISVVVPLYLTEIAPAHLRGRSVTAFQIFLTFGILLAYVVDLFFTHVGDWRAMFAIILIPTAILFFSMLFLPETPRWLMSHGKMDLAKDILCKLRPAHLVQIEIDCILEGVKNTKRGTWKDLFAKQHMSLLAVSLIIAICNQFTGINVILQYAPMVMKAAGISSELAAMMATVGIGAVNFLATLIALALIDYVGRKRLLMVGTGGVVLANVYLALCSVILPVGPSQSVFVLFGLLVYIASFAIGPGVIVWLAISELLPTKVRGKTVALCLFVNSVAATMLSSTFLSIQKAIGMSSTYWLFAGFTLIYFLVAKYLLPETNGKELEDIQKKHEPQILSTPKEALS
ncbi:MAG: csbC 1 [Gammaproteobacteria bacterium]|jgi:sugar porter (SP) family MFS transporter|nr:csbC 1 [Gammaproteobacteria bacterium]